eukprot:220503_1
MSAKSSNSLLKTLSIIIGVIAIGLGYILNYSDLKYKICKKLVENTFRKRFAYNDKVFCMIFEDGKKYKYGITTRTKCDATIILHNENLFFERLVMHYPSIGFGEAYFNKYWSEADGSDLGDIVTYFMQSSYNRNPNSFEVTTTGRTLKWILDCLSVPKWKDWYEREIATTKSEEEDARTISYHYEHPSYKKKNFSDYAQQETIFDHYKMDTVFYKLFLGRTMLYSCGFFDEEHNITSLDDAQDNKLRILMNKMNIKQNKMKQAKILDIGSGWGYTGSYFLNITGTNVSDSDTDMISITLSKDQYQYSDEMYGHFDNLKYFYKDYRKMYDVNYKNYFDGVISIGMLEHVHSKRLDEYMNATAYSMKDGAVFGLHYITRNDIHPLNTDINNGRMWPYNNGIITRKHGCNKAGYISKYIFPGGCLLLSDWVQESAAKYGLVQLHKEFYGLHYAKTVWWWRKNFNDNWRKNEAELLRYGYDDNLFRIWNIYLATCEGAFRVQYADLVQQVFVKKSKSDHDKLNHFRKISNINQQDPVCTNL